jgi:hypothetical protein
MQCSMVIGLELDIRSLMPLDGSTWHFCDFQLDSQRLD